MRGILLATTLAAGLVLLSRGRWARLADELRAASDRAMVALLRATSGFEAELQEGGR